MTSPPIPAFVNPHAGSAAAARQAIEADPRFHLREVEPDGLADAIRSAVEEGSTRILVAGGDGTIAGAAAVLAGTGVELAVLPGGTLNHFAGYLKLPTDPAEALEIAATGAPREVDAAYVNDRLFINTSVVGSYVAFVRLRDRWQPYLGYWLASLAAGLRLFLTLPRYRIRLEVDGHVRHYHTPLLFVGVGERELSDPSLSAHDPEGRRGLHVVVVRRWRRARVVALGMAAAHDGARGVGQLPDVDSFIVDRCTVELRRHHARLGVDGEIVMLGQPLSYRAAPGVLRVVGPGGTGAQQTARG